MKMKFNLKHKWPNYDCCCCVEGMMLCCGTTIDVVGVAGTMLLLAGLVEMAAGVYFMLTLPIFEVASNIWTGVVTGFAGSVLMYYGSTNQTRRRNYVILTLTVITLVTSIINLVIVQAGEKGAFLSKKNLEIIEIRGKSLHLEIAIWLTTAASALGMLCSFFVAQFVFCSQLRPKFKASVTHVDGHKRSFDANRFFPPSRLVGSKVESPTDNLPDILHGNTGDYLHEPGGRGNSVPGTGAGNGGGDVAMQGYYVNKIDEQETEVVNSPQNEQKVDEKSLSKTISRQSTQRDFRESTLIRDKNFPEKFGTFRPRREILMENILSERKPRRSSLNLEKESENSIYTVPVDTKNESQSDDIYSTIQNLEESKPSETQTKATEKEQNSKSSSQEDQSIPGTILRNTNWKSTERLISKRQSTLNRKIKKPKEPPPKPPEKTPGAIPKEGITNADIHNIEIT